MRSVPEDDLYDSAVNHVGVLQHVSFLHTLAVATKSIDIPAGMGIIGFGRIGRLIFHAAVQIPDVSVKGIIEPFMNVDYMVYQLKYDSVHKRYPGTVCSKKDGDEVHLVVNGVEVQVFKSKDPTAMGSV
jgi:hypothetical protein